MFKIINRYSRDNELNEEGDPIRVTVATSMPLDGTKRSVQ